MAEDKAAKTTAATQGNDHDKVAMLSIGKDGTPDQHDPEIIGNKEFALDATKRQFRENAVSAVDTELRSVGAPAGEELKPDPATEELRKAQDKAGDAAETAAEKVVNALHKG
jgi:hypothetical protein